MQRLRPVNNVKVHHSFHLALRDGDGYPGLGLLREGESGEYMYL